jgi:hypothetical protein
LLSGVLCCSRAPHELEQPQQVSAAARVRLVAETPEILERGGAALVFGVPEDEESKRALFDAAVFALTGGVEAPDAASGWFLTFRIHSDRALHRFEFCDLRYENELQIPPAEITATDGGYCFALLSWPTGAGWCLLQWESDGIPAAVARGPWNADALPTPSGAGRSTRFASRDSRCWFVQGGHLWRRDPNDPFAVHISFNGPDTDRLAMASSPRSKRWLAKGMAADDRTAYDALVCVPLAQWKEPVWRLIVLASPAPR